MNATSKRVDKALELVESGYDINKWGSLAGSGGKSGAVGVLSAFLPNSMGREIAWEFENRCMKAAEYAARNEFARSAAEVAVAVELYRRANGGTMPETLSALVPDYLPAVPKDPCKQDMEIGYNAMEGTVSSVGRFGRGFPSLSICIVERWWRRSGDKRRPDQSSDSPSP